MGEPDLSDVMTFDAAGRAVHRSRHVVEAIAIRHGIALDWGGGPKRRWLRVKLSELKAAILKERFTPRRAALEQATGRSRQSLRSRPRPGAGALDPLVKC